MSSIGIVGVLVLVVVMACGGLGAAAAAAELTPLRIVATGLDTAPFMAALQIIVEKGWFKEVGIDATLSSGRGGGSTITPVVTGDADMTIGSPSASVLAAMKEPGLKIIGPWFQANDFVWVSPRAVTDPAELKGKTIAFSGPGSTTELLARAVAAKIGVVPTPAGSPAASWVAAKSGRIFAGWATHPIATVQVKEGGFVVIRGTDYVPNFVTDLVLVNANFAKANPDALRNFWKVIEKGFNYIVQQPEASAVDVGRIMRMAPADVLQGYRDTPNLQRAYSLKVDPLALKAVSDLMLAAGQISKPVDWKAIFDEQYLPEWARTAL